jgi:hypothetical protein
VRPDSRIPRRHPGEVTHVEALLRQVFGVAGEPAESERDWGEVLARAGEVVASSAPWRGVLGVRVPETLGWGTRPL